MQTLFYGGSIVTMQREPYAQALLCEGTNILAVGSKAALDSKAAPDCHKVNLQGAALLPGFVDAHSHFSAVAMSFLQVSVEEASTEEEIADAVSDFLLRTKPAPGSWVQVRGYDHTALPGAAHLSLAFLDQICPHNPLLVQHKSGHFGLVNSAALQKLGITAATPDPAGGRIGHDAAGQPNGYLEENAFLAAQKTLPLPKDADLLDACRKAQALYAGYGITTVQEGMVSAELLPLYTMLADCDLLNLDIVAYPDAATWGAATAALPGRVGHYQNHLRWGGVKMFLDGSPQGRTAWLRAPYAGEASYAGYPALTDEQVCQTLALAGEQDIQVLAHCNGDAAAQQYLDCLQRMEQRYPRLKKHRPVMIHAQLLHPDQMPQALALGVVPSFFVAHVYHWGDVHLHNLGPVRAAQISPAASALRCGLPFTFHQDAPVIQPDMLETLWCAATRRTRAGVVLGEQECLPVSAALRAVTATAAWQYGEAASKGTLAAGKRADLVILDGNPLKTPPEKLRSLQVLATFKDGQPVYKR